MSGLRGGTMASPLRDAGHQKFNELLLKHKPVEYHRLNLILDLIEVDICLKQGEQLWHVSSDNIG